MKGESKAILFVTTLILLVNGLEAGAVLEPATFDPRPPAVAAMTYAGGKEVLQFVGTIPMEGLRAGSTTWPRAPTAGVCLLPRWKATWWKRSTPNAGRSSAPFEASKNLKASTTSGRPKDWPWQVAAMATSVSTTRIRSSWAP
jgi:hypothetical protein